ncbi:hypothetical protein OESDEN_13022 [Oesophagostomum dentatum]|uniref:Uncharacterized protein n=1 Tax=Oesophagostomum dentatum TaxID=61180 RepID=A0A0B1SQJ3_OESDE|nr:hypothetical protein OESDEN_13022 [Oesophagostomum dentatum]
MNKMEKIFDKDTLRSGDQHVGFANSKGRHAAGDDESGTHLSAVNSYIDQTKQHFKVDRWINFRTVSGTASGAAQMM